MELPTRFVDDPRALRALAHPVRQRILKRLSRRGPATSAILARELGEDRGATSFHLRQLGRYGFIEVDGAASSGRRKYWRIVREDLRFPRERGGEGADGAATVLSMLWEDGIESLIRFRDEGDPWASDAVVSHSDLRLTREELRSFTESYMKLLREYARSAEEPSADARTVIALFAAFPPPDEP